MQQRQEIEERMRRVRQQREQMYQQHREALLQQRQRQEDELRRQNQLRFIQHMTQPAGARQPLQVGQNTINVQTRFPTAATAPRPPPPSYQPITLRYSLPSTVRLSIPSTVAAPSPVTPPTINLTLGPSIRPLSPTNPQLPPVQNPTPKWQHTLCANWSVWLSGSWAPKWCEARRELFPDFVTSFYASGFRVLRQQIPILIVFDISSSFSFRELRFCNLVTNVLEDDVRVLKCEINN